MTAKNSAGNWALLCSGMELYGDWIKYEENLNFFYDCLKIENNLIISLTKNVF